MLGCSTSCSLVSLFLSNICFKSRFHATCRALPPRFFFSRHRELVLSARRAPSPILRHRLLSLPPMTDFRSSPIDPYKAETVARVNLLPAIFRVND